MVFFICLPGDISKQEVSTRKTTANGTRPCFFFFFFFFSGRNLIFYKPAGGKEQFSPDYDSILGQIKISSVMASILLNHKIIKRKKKKNKKHSLILIET